jgi:hypothetical protein
VLPPEVAGVGQTNIPSSKTTRTDRDSTSLLFISFLLLTLYTQDPRGEFILHWSADSARLLQNRFSVIAKKMAPVYINEGATNSRF